MLPISIPNVPNGRLWQTVVTVSTSDIFCVKFHAYSSMLHIMLLVLGQATLPWRLCYGLGLTFLHMCHVISSSLGLFGRSCPSMCSPRNRGSHLVCSCGYEGKCQGTTLLCLCLHVFAIAILHVRHVVMSCPWDTCAGPVGCAGPRTVRIGTVRGICYSRGISSVCVLFRVVSYVTRSNTYSTLRRICL